MAQEVKHWAFKAEGAIIVTFHLIEACLFREKEDNKGLEEEEGKEKGVRKVRNKKRGESWIFGDLWPAANVHSVRQNGLII